MAISILQQPDAYSFCATLKDTVIAATANVAVTLTDRDTAAVILSETYTPDASGNIVIRALYKVLQGVIDKVSLIGNYTLSASCSADNLSFDFTVQYATVEIDVDPDIFLATRFLSVLQGAKTTAPDRKEYISLKVNIPTEIVAVCTYTKDGVITTANMAGITVNDTDGIVTVDVSPVRFQIAGYVLEKYTVTAGARTQTFFVDNLSPAGASSFVMINSFGVKETFSCMGLLDRENKYDDSLYGNFSNSYRKYHTNLVKVFTSTTGILSQQEAEWIEDLFLSKSIFLYDASGTGKEITILEPSVHRTSDSTELAAISFTWRYAQENQQLYIYTTVTSPGTRTRIFDKTFDKSFN